MKRAAVVILAVGLVLGLFVSAHAEFKKTKIAVLDFQLHGDRYDTADMGKIVAEWLITALVKEGRFDVIERRLLEKVISEQKLGVSGVVDEASASSLGRVLGAKVIISGSVMKFQNVMEVNARIIDVQSSSVIAAESVKSTSTVKLEDLVVEMAEKIISDFPLEGYIVQRTGNTVLIDLGKRAGVKTGMQFVVYKEGNVIKHPKTGEVLDIEVINTGMVEVKGIKDKTADGEIVNETSKGAIEYGQMVKSAYSERENHIAPSVTDRRRIVVEDAVPQDVGAMIASIDFGIEELKQVKESGNKNWKFKFKEVVRQIKTLERRKSDGPELWMAWAKLYRAIDEPGAAQKYLDRAIAVRPNLFEAYVMKGDIYYEETMKLPSDKRIKKGKGPDAVKAYEAAAASVNEAGIKAMLYMKIGNIYADVSGNADKANEYWQKAVSTAPKSDGARLAGERLANK